MSRSLVIAYDCLYPYTTGGGERQYRAFAEAAVARGRRVEYLTTQQWPNTEVPAESFAVSAVSSRLRLYDAAGVRRTGAALAFAWKLFRALRARRHADEAIVSGLPVFNVFAARAALAGSKTALAVDYLEVWGRAQWVDYAGRAIGSLAWIAQRLAIRLTRIATCHSQLTADRLRREGFRGTLLLSPGLIDPASLPHAAVAPAAEPPFVLYAGRHIPDKRVETLPAAVAFARRSIPDLRLTILGAGPSTDAIARSIADLRAADWAQLPGFVDERTLHRLRGSAACLVNPSRREGYGLVVVEAAAAGTPSVLVRDPGNASVELVQPGLNGAIAASTAPDALGQAIVDAVTGGLPLRESTRAWYDDAVRTRTIRHTVDRILDVLEHPSSREAHRV